MKVIWTPEVLQDRIDFWDYIATDNPQAAALMDELFSDSARLLIEQPKLGRVGKIPGTHELVAHAHDRLVYEITFETIGVLTLIHNARRWPPARLDQQSKSRAVMQTSW